MNDIVERLKAGDPCGEEGGNRCKDMSVQGGCLCAIAANEIERLRAQVADERARAVEECAKMAASVRDMIRRPDEKDAIDEVIHAILDI